MRQIFISALMEAGTRGRRRYASSRAVTVLGGANGGDVVAAIGVTIGQAKASPALNCPGAGGICSELRNICLLHRLHSVPGRRLLTADRIPVDGSDGCAFH
ncbi:hypothetical protein M405DRAFT_505642 [Rhizopogon salebrosus TDB-379]|nr:hypothetical protein M405DRAFT_505642 [Rhizopogon salebrosus TDB-379]